ncbi:MAG: hypothetical protein K6T66_00985 [Peptococcaceae bacterium]|nr:hypothetical protein [Peptococcaceae bacterium]
MVPLNPGFLKIIEVQNKAIEMQYKDWLQKDLFSFQFWLLLAALVFPWIAWWKLADRKRLLEILLYGLLVQTAVTLLDEIGCQLNLWEYPYDIEPIFPRMIPINITVLPVSYMLVYQFFPEWKRFLAANILLAVFFAFVAEPAVRWMGIYVLFKWKFIYSFPIYIILALFLKWVMNRILAWQR